MRVHWSSVQTKHGPHYQAATVLPQWSVLYVKETQPPDMSAALEIFVLLVGRRRVKAEWRSVWRGSGGLCVTVGGAKERQLLCVDKVDLEREVGKAVYCRMVKFCFRTIFGGSVHRLNCSKLNCSRLI